MHLPRDADIPATSTTSSLCAFERIDPHQVRCRRCHRKVISARDDPARIIARCRESIPAGRPAGLLRRVWDVSAAVAVFVADGLRTVSAEQYRQRLSICQPCPERRDNRCLQCGCRLSLKAQGRAFQCPLKKWPAITPHEPTAS